MSTDEEIAKWVEMRKLFIYQLEENKTAFEKLEARVRDNERRLDKAMGYAAGMGAIVSGAITILSKFV